MDTSFDRNSEDGKDEWLTPPEIVKALGEFDLDPCAPTPDKRPWDTAKNHYSILDDGLNKPWFGRVFCNSPYGSEMKHWLKKCAEHKNVIALLFARTETRQFFDSIWPYAKAIVFIKGRLNFYHVDGTKGGTAGAPSMLVAYDNDNAEALYIAIKSGTIKGAFCDFRNNPVVLG